MKNNNLCNKQQNNPILKIVPSNEIFKINDTIQFKHHEMHDFVSTKIINVDETTVTVRFVESFLGLNFFPKDHILLVCTFCDEIYLVDGKIEFIQALSPYEISIKIEKIIRRKALRKSKRFFVNLIAEIHPSKDTGARNVFVIVKNISISGFKINSKDDINLNELLAITISIDKYHKFICTAKVIRKNPLKDFYEYGIKILEISDSNLLILEHYINEMNLYL